MPMSKITNNSLTQSGTDAYSCSHMATVGLKGLIVQLSLSITPAGVVTL